MGFSAVTVCGNTRRPTHAFHIPLQLVAVHGSLGQPREPDDARLWRDMRAGQEVSLAGCQRPDQPARLTCFPRFAPLHAGRRHRLLQPVLGLLRLPKERPVRPARGRRFFALVEIRHIRSPTIRRTNPRRARRTCTRSTPTRRSSVSSSTYSTVSTSTGGSSGSDGDSSSDGSVPRPPRTCTSSPSPLHFQRPSHHPAHLRRKLMSLLPAGVGLKVGVAEDIPPGCVGPSCQAPAYVAPMPTSCRAPTQSSARRRRRTPPRRT